MEVHIGCIEVKVDAPPRAASASAPAPAPAPAPRAAGLDTYRHIRTYADRNWY